MNGNKTRPQSGDVEAYLDAIEDPGMREDCRTLSALMKGITGDEPVMWGDTIVGFGSYHYRYDSGREGDWFRVGFSPRKQALTIYIMGYLEKYGHILEGLGKYKHGKGCLYVKRLTDIDMGQLEKLIRTSTGSSEHPS